jgi:hypothetical protein
MIVLFKTRFFRKTRLICPCLICALLAVAAPGARADYTAGTPSGAGKITVDPDTGDRKVEVTPPPSSSTQNQPQTPVYVYPEVGRPGPHPPHSGQTPGSQRPTARKKSNK